MSNIATPIHIGRFSDYQKMTELERDFIKLVDDFVINSTDADILEEIEKLDMEARLLGISFYDMYCVVLQDVAGHQNLVSRFKIYMQSKKSI
ncbi:MAG: hypothetical protein ACREAE_09190 [Nitrosopumilaceae archaeon]